MCCFQNCETFCFRKSIYSGTLDERCQRDCKFCNRGIRTWVVEERTLTLRSSAHGQILSAGPQQIRVSLVGAFSTAKCGLHLV